MELLAKVLEYITGGSAMGYAVLAFLVSVFAVQLVSSLIAGAKDLWGAFTDDGGEHVDVQEWKRNRLKEVRLNEEWDDYMDRENERRGM